MNALSPPTNPTEAYLLQLAALVQIGRPLTVSVPYGISTTIDLQCAIKQAEKGLLELHVALMREHLRKQS